MNAGDSERGIDVDLMSTGHAVLTGYVTTPEQVVRQIAELAAVDRSI